MNELKYETVNGALLAALPELQSKYKEARAFFSEEILEQQYTMFGHVLEPVLLELLDSGGNPALLTRVFEFFEAMARSSDVNVVNLLQVEILEGMVRNRSRLAVAWKYMGQETKSLVKETAGIWRQEENLPIGH